MKRFKHPNYPWSRWIERGKLRLLRGQHYDCDSASMAQQARNAAYRNGVRASITWSQDWVKIEWRAK